MQWSSETFEFLLLAVLTEMNRNKWDFQKIMQLVSVMTSRDSEHSRDTVANFQSLEKHIAYDRVHERWVDSRKYELISFLALASQREQFPLPKDLVRALRTYGV